MMAIDEGKRAGRSQVTIRILIAEDQALVHRGAGRGR
jgi:hypothetical protein